MCNKIFGRISVARHRSELVDIKTQPVYSALHRSESKRREFEKIEIEKTSSQDIVEATLKEWVAPTVYAPRKGGTSRFCGDFREGNAVTKRKLYSIPWMDERNDSLDEATTILNIEANSAYSQVQIDDTKKNETVFIPCYELY